MEQIKGSYIEVVVIGNKVDVGKCFFGTPEDFSRILTKYGEIFNPIIVHLPGVDWRTCDREYLRMICEQRYKKFF